ncbi:MAG TPA: protein kinase [Polyangiales bacterium]|nr:protein kinase [Polyangiales bacterium]
MGSEVASVTAGGLVAGKYRLETLLGRGGMGAVYAARHVLTGRRFAIKLLSRELTGDPGAEERFMREAMLASAIQHPAIVEVYDVGRDRGVPYMVMKLLQGETLGDRLVRGPLAPDEAIALLMPVIDGIAAAHAHGIVHRDIKPDNVLIEREGDRERPRVLDFGISKLLNSDARRPAITRPGTIIGTPQYMAPEQVRGDRDLDARCDVYSLGVILYEMVTGALPFAGKDVPALLLAITDGSTVPGIRTRRPELPVELESVVARAMEPRLELRYADAAELGRALLALGLARASQLPSKLMVAQLASSRPSGAAASPSGTQRLPSQLARSGNPLSTPASRVRASPPAEASEGTARSPISRPSSAAPLANVASPSTPVVELTSRTTLPPSATLYAGAALGALVVIGAIAFAVLPSAHRAPPRAAAAAASKSAPMSVAGARAPSPSAEPRALAPSAPALVLPSAVIVAQPTSDAGAQAQPAPARERLHRSSRAARAARDSSVKPAEEPQPRRTNKTRVDMPSLSSEILDPFE